MPPKISVIMSTYKEPIEWIITSIQSILDQTYSNIELIIVCDDPNNFEAINYLDGITDKRVIIYKNNVNIGLINSLNIAINLATGQYIARMDADDISLPNRLEEQLSYLESEKLDLCGCNAYLFIEDKIIGKTNKLIKHSSIEKLMIYGDIGVIHPTFFGKKELFLNIKYNLNAIYAEDMEFLAHALSLGYRIGNCEKHLFKYRYSNSSITRQKSYQQYITTRNIHKCFIRSKKFGNYNFSNEIVKNEMISEKYSKSRILLAKSKELLSEKKYFQFLWNIFFSFINAPKLFFHAIKIALLIDVLKNMEEK